MLADLSGAFAPLVTEIVAAQKVYWDKVNADGGIAGRQVELDDRGQRLRRRRRSEKFEAMRDEVAIISQSTGSPHTAAIAEQLVDDDLIAIPLSWYSGWAIRELGQNALESYTNYCLESMNGIEWLTTTATADGRDHLVPRRVRRRRRRRRQARPPRQLGLEVVYDGAGQVTPPSADNPNPDQTA